MAEGAGNKWKGIILAGVLVGAATAGVLGVFLAAPGIASLREILGYLYRKALNLEPFPAAEPSPPTAHPQRSIWTWARRLREVFITGFASRAI